MVRVLTLPTLADAGAARYSSVAIVIHWVVAALLLGQVALGWRMAAAHGAARFTVFQLHKSIGITILLLVALGLAWRLYRHPPRAIGHGWERTLAAAVHPTLYFLLFALPISGWIIISTSRIVVPTLLYGAVPWPHFPGTGALASSTREMWNSAARFTHVNLLLVLYALFALHVAGALKHQLIDRDRTIARMAPGVQPGAWTDPRLLLIALTAGLALALGLWAPLGRVKQSAPPPLVIAPVSTTGSPVSAPSAPPPAAAPVTSAVPPVAPLSAAVPASAALVSGPVPVAMETAAPAAVPSWTILPGSTLHWRTTWSGDGIDGGFKRFDGDIVFDPDQLDKSHVAIRVDTASVFSGDAQRDATLASADWFATGANPAATFTATRFRRTGAGRYVAAGTLSLKGVTLPLPVSFTLAIKDNTATMHGSATIDRTAFKIGEGEFAATTDIPAAVTLDVVVTAKRQ